MINSMMARIHGMASLGLFILGLCEDPEGFFLGLARILYLVLVP